MIASTETLTIEEFAKRYGVPETVSLTITEFAKRWNVTYATASGLINYLKSKDLAKESGKKPRANGRGVASTIYTVPTKFVIEL